MSLLLLFSGEGTPPVAPTAKSSRISISLGIRISAILLALLLS